MLLLSILPVWAAETYLPFRSDLPAGTAYTIDARRLHPTQFAVGFREVASKIKAINGKDAANLLRNGVYVVGEGANMPTTISADAPSGYIRIRGRRL